MPRLVIRLYAYNVQCTLMYMHLTYVTKHPHRHHT